MCFPLITALHSKTQMQFSVSPGAQSLPFDWRAVEKTSSSRLDVALVATDTGTENWKVRVTKKKVPSKQALQISVLTCPLCLDGLLAKITRGTPGSAQSRPFAGDGKSSLPSNGLCVDCCCLACCTSLTRFQNGSRAGSYKRRWVKKLTWGENTEASGAQSWVQHVL